MLRSVGFSSTYSNYQNAYLSPFTLTITIFTDILYYNTLNWWWDQSIKKQNDSQKTTIRRSVATYSYEIMR